MKMSFYFNRTISICFHVLQANIDQCASFTQDVVAGGPGEQAAEM